MLKLPMDNIDQSQLVWKILRLTETAISLVDSNKIDEALALIENRDRAMSILMRKISINDEDIQTLTNLDKLNTVLLDKLINSRENLKNEIQSTHKTSTAHKAYHSGQTK